MTSRVVNPHRNIFISHNPVINLTLYKKVSVGIHSDFGDGKRIRRSNDGKRETVVSLFHREPAFDDSGEKGSPERRCSKREKQQPFAVAQEEIYPRINGYFFSFLRNNYVYYYLSKLLS